MELGSDLWHQLPAADRTQALEAARQQYGRIFEGVAGAAGPWWPLRPVVVSAGFHRDLGVLADRLAGLVLEACRRRANTAGELLDALGVPAGDMPLLRPEEVLGDELLVASRADVVLDGGVPKFVEINIDGAIGGTSQSDLVSRRFQSIYAAEVPGLHLAVPPSALDARFAAIREQLGGTDDAVLAIPMYEHGVLAGVSSEAERIERHRPVIESARRFGITATPHPWREFSNDSAHRLLARDQPVDMVLRLFVSATEPGSAGLSALIRAVQHGTVQMHTAEASWLLSNKTIFAWLWTDVELLTPEDQQLVRTHVPWTVVVDSHGSEHVSAGLADRAAWVLKPTSGHGGAGVVLGHAVSDDAWRSALLAAADGGHVLQRFIEADLLDMTFVDDRTGQLRDQPVPMVLGPFLFGRTISNVIVRHGTPASGSVVNAQQGANLNSILIASAG